MFTYNININCFTIWHLSNNKVPILFIWRSNYYFLLLNPFSHFRFMNWTRLWRANYISCKTCCFWLCLWFFLVHNQIFHAYLFDQMITNMLFFKLSIYSFFFSLYWKLFKHRILKLLLWNILIHICHLRCVFTYFRSIWSISKGVFVLSPRLCLKSSCHVLLSPLQLLQMNVFFRYFVLLATFFFNFLYLLLSITHSLHFQIFLNLNHLVF